MMISIHLGDDEKGAARKAALERLAQQFGVYWNGEPSIGRLIVEIAEGHIKLNERRQGKMNTTIWVCSVCGETTARWENTDNWLIANVQDGEMVIRCPEHINEYAIRKAGGKIVDGKGQVGHWTFELSPVQVTTRSKFAVRITNYWSGDGEADFASEIPSKLTARQAMAEYESYHPAGSTHFTAFECIAPDGKRYNLDDLRMLVKFGMTK